jgi:proline iminopeptidase
MARWSAFLARNPGVLMPVTRRGFLGAGAAVAAAAVGFGGRAAAAEGETSGFAAVNGQKLYYVTLGQGVPVIFLHGGLGFDHQYFRPFLDPLADSAKLVFYDLLGHGKSDRPADFADLTFARLSSDCDALATALGFEKFVLVGHSYGGFIALDFALRYPRRLAGLVLTCTAPDLTSGMRDPLGGTAEQQAALRAGAKENATDAALRANWRAAVPLYYNNANPPVGVVADVDSRTIYSAAGSLRGSEILRGFAVVSRLPTLETPTLVQYGAGDIWRFGDNERLAKNIPGAKLIYFANSGHWPFQEEPDAYLAAMRGFLAGLPDR